MWVGWSTPAWLYLSCDSPQFCRRLQLMALECLCDDVIISLEVVGSAR